MLPEPELTEEQRAATPCLVGLCATCSYLLACAVQCPQYAKVSDQACENARHVASWVRDGLKVETWTVAQVRSGKWCHCLREKKGKRKTQDVAK
jgi:hypothetical protein